ncbi:hypothetical protein LTR56_017137 [Elasticomyces elasticus]|nr:hypothetical protein LTR22_021793 [Elasticomyces elasticus]KAK3630992.1 hypothetical protein LTR56_017137 [Elasticomyces elasticus]KAK4908805.1 hypothetical protein LTR49_022371 [Elasticomyces elasticus]KAK5748807.1 hypothetical protein LTS12_021158 [Elasticomyces elasticus]
MGSVGIQEQIQCPLLEPRFSALKQSIIKPENKQKVVESYKRLVKACHQEATLIGKAGPSIVPEIDFEDVLRNGGEMPEGLVDLVRDRGCIIFRNVVPTEQAEAWEAELKDYTKRHSAVGGFPADNPQSWSLWWTRPQVQIRSHPRVLAAVNTISKLWHVSNSSAPVDLSAQVAYPDRFRIRYPTNDAEFTLNAHVDSGSTERWEDPTYRANYQAILDGEWEKSRHPSSAPVLENLDRIPHAPAIFLDKDDAVDDVTPTFPGAHPGGTQVLPTTGLHPDLMMEKSIVGIPPVKPGDYVFWHCDLIHEVDKYHPGSTDSSVVYNASTPLVPYNIDSLRATRQSFLDTKPPRDFNGIGYLHEEEHMHEDHGARQVNILSDEGRRAMGFEKYDVDEAGLSEGARKVRQMANEVLGNG